MNNKIWVEKYRPTDISKIVNQDEIKLFIEGAIREKNIPHLLLYGSPGTGKTTIINILIKSLYTYTNNEFPDKFTLFEENRKLKSDRVLSLNASDERGIKVIREKIKTFANLAIIQSSKDVNIPPFKVIVLDEADAMSSDSQFALRRIMEKYSTTTRFILICNYVTKIIAPLASRCSKFRFQPINYSGSKETIEYILQKEGYKIILSDEIYNYIYNNTNGDMRKTITLFQRLNYIGYINDLTIDKVREVIGEIPDDIINNLISLLNNKITIQNQINIYKEIKNIISNGFNCLLLLNHLYNNYINDIIDDKIKGKIIIKLSEIDNRLNEGSIEIIQLTDLLFTINGLVNGINYKITNNPFNITV